MLTDEVKKTVQTAYREILERKSLTPRHGQRLMIAEIAKSLASIPPAVDEDPESAGDGEGSVSSQADSTPPPICVIEAGTGTGKTLAYVLGTLPLAQALGKKVVLATATVALQEQIIHKDLPDIKAHSGLEFSYTLAKGRGRYLCLSRLDMLLQDNDSQQAMQELFGDILEQPDTAHNRELYQEMLDKVSSGEWQGDRDDWDGIVSDADWKPLTVEAGQCAGQKCSNFSRCCFYKAREEVQKVDCVVANHDLVLVDLALGGGAILPAPEDSIYIFDEAHHLPIKSNGHFACVGRLQGTRQWLDNCTKTLTRLGADTLLGEQSQIRHLQAPATESLAAVSEQLGLLVPMFEQIADELEADAGAGGQDGARHTFKLGVVPDEIRALSGELGKRFSRLQIHISDIANQLKRDMEGADSLQARQRAEHWFPLLGGMANRAEGAQKLWLSFARKDPDRQAPWARWLSLVELGGGSDIQLACSPVLAADALQDNLWERCAGAVLTSATLSALGNFDVLAMRAGLPAHTVYHRIASPFDYNAAARFIVPRVGCDPGDSVAHTRAIIRLLPQLINKPEASLMLFSSRRQMQEVLDGMDREWREIILCQDDYQKTQLLRFHRERVDRGETSVIFGLASFAEGVDLPGKYCEHVLIAKLPFAVPNDPIEGTLAEWLEQQGRNPFMTLAVPEAALRLVQASGRLLRSESDRGCITLFDERIVNRRYGQAILDSLPPFRREIFPAWLDRPAGRLVG